MTKAVKTVANISKLSPTHFVSNILGLLSGGQNPGVTFFTNIDLGIIISHSANGYRIDILFVCS